MKPAPTVVIYSFPQILTHYTVLRNLLDNAIKFSEQGSIIRIEGQRKESFICISVTDQGPGVPQKFRKKVFDEFFQIPGLRGDRPGIGLGLAICRRIIEAHNGEIFVENSRSQGGARFSFTIPISDTPIYR